MTETDKTENYELVLQEFEGSSIKFIKKDDKIWISSSSIATGLDISRDNVNQIYYSNKMLLEPYIRNMKVISDDNRPREVRVFDKTGFIGVCMRSNSARAVPFQKWALNIIDNVLNKGFYIEKGPEIGSSDWIIQQLDTMRAIALKQKQVEEKVLQIESKIETVNIDVKDFKQQYEDERIITPQTMKTIRDMIQECVRNSGDHYGHFYKLIHEKFQISGVKGVTEKLGQVIIKWMKLNPKFITYLD